MTVPTTRTDLERRRWRSAFTALVFALVIGLALAPAARADRWYVHYENAERALAAEEWRRAVEELQQALERRGDSGLRVRSYGMKVVDYFPYLKLGIAYHHLGQDEAALEAFDTEERLGVVQGSPAASSELEDYRRRVTAARTELADAEQRRGEEILDQALTEARRLEEEGRLDEAMKALGRGLAVAPEDPEANRRMTSLRRRAVEAERAESERMAQAASLERARGHLARGEDEQAARLLREVLAQESLKPAARTEAQRMLGQARDRLAASMAAAERGAEIEAGLAQARTLESSGRIDEALDHLERVFALEPEQPQAAALRRRLLAAQQASEQEGWVRDTLRRADEHLEAGRFEDALSAANRVLALERGQPEALEIVRRAYGEISRRLLGADRSENIPPAIRFADRRQDLDGERVEIVDQPEFRLSGVVIDASPVTVTLLDGQGRAVESSSSSQPVGEYFVTEFSVRRRVEAGTSTLAVEATDSEGLSSRSEYLVRYRRPWFRSPALGAGAGALALGLGAGLLFERSRRRRLRVRRRFNPYVAGGPIFDETLFFGREPLIQRILQTVHNNSLLLYGERRIGKTSLLHQLERRLEALDDPVFAFYPVYIDLQGTPEDRFFATLADQIHETLAPEVGDAGRTPARLRPGGYDHHDLARELHGWLKALAETNSRQVKVVLLIDEVDELNHYHPRVNQSLRSLFMKRFAQNLAAVVAGVGIRKEWEQEASPWYNFFEEIEVSPIADEEALRLILEPVRSTFRFDPAAARRVVEESGGRPFLIQRRCLALIQRLHEEGRRTVTVDDVEAVTTAPHEDGDRGAMP